MEHGWKDAGWDLPWDAVDDALVARYDVPGPRYTSYPTAPEWVEGWDGAEDALSRGARVPDQPLSLYAHLPFCETMCAFCGCNVVLAKDRDRVSRYLDDLDRELDLLADRLGARNTLSQVHLGGGTPTFLRPDQLERLWASITRRFRIVPGAEVALEANPRITTRDHLLTLTGLGFNRLSVGVQDLDPGVQEVIRRVHDAETVGRLLDEARDAGFQGINCDLVYGLPRQTPDTFRRTLEQVVDRLRPDRLAVYSFAYVPDLRHHQRLLPADEIPRGAARLRLLEQAHRVLGGAGYLPIGMDHFARSEDPLAVASRDGSLGRNFQGYTVRRAPETIAIGVTGISEIAGTYFQNHRSMALYRAALEQGRLATQRGIQLDADDLVRKELITRILCQFGADLDGVSGQDWSWERERLSQPDLGALATWTASQVRATPLGRMFIRNVAMVFDARLRRSAPGATPRFSRTV